MKRSNIHLQYNAPVTLTFFFLSLASLALGHLTNGWTTYHLFSVYRSSLADPLFFVRLFGHVLGHAGWDHFIGNMLLFLVIAPPAGEALRQPERRYSDHFDPCRCAQPEPADI